MFIIYLTVQLTRLAFVYLLIALWVTWCIIALPIAGIANLTGHQQAARTWVRTCSWDILTSRRLI